MRIFPLSEGSFTIDHTKVFVPFDTAIENLQHRPKGSLLVEIQPFVVVTNNDIILFDTGLGYMGKSGKLQLHENLIQCGINPSQVTKVFMSHLHKDHAGGISYIDPSNQSRYLSFPYAKYYIQQQEYLVATEGQNPSYQANELRMLEHYSGVVWLTEEKGVIDNLIHYQRTDGHSLYHQVAWIHDEDTIFFFGGDEAPQLQQMKSKFIAKYDWDGKKAMQWRQLWWDQGTREKWTFAFYHDIQYPKYCQQP